MREHLVVVGAGMVGLRFLEELTARAPGRFRVTVVGKESEPAYNRVLLSALLAGEVEPAAIRLRGRDWYAGNRIELVLNDGALGIDTGKRQLRLESGRTLEFDRLVLAMGSEPLRPAIPGIDLEGVLTFRDLKDVAAIRGRAAPPARAVVIGGGLLGIEAAWGLARAGCVVTIVHLMDRLMERQLDARAAGLLKASIEARHMIVLLQAQTAAIIGEERVEGVRLTDARMLPADLVVVAIGIRPMKELAEAAGIACGRGILVDDALETDVAGIHAIGECAEHGGLCYGLVEPGYAQARVLANRLAGGDDRYTGSVLATNLKVSGVHVFSTGDFLGAEDTEEIVLFDPGLLSYKRLVVRRADGAQRLVGAVLFGDTFDGLWYQELIGAGTPIDRMRPDVIFGRDFVEAAA